MQHEFEHREQFEQLGRDGCAAGLCGQAHAQVVFYREAGKNFAALGDISHAECGTRVGGELADVFAIKMNAARGQGLYAHQALQ